jgi:hypothetical protein
MNRFQIARLHFQRFRTGPLWWIFWSLVWVLQLINGHLYRVQTPKVSLDMWTAVLVMLHVFYGGNFFSARNNPCLRTLPLPRGTCFCVDVILPLLCFLPILLFREIPPWIQSGFPMTSLLWAWTDILLMYVPLLSSVWLLGCLLPPLRTPLLFGANLVGMLLSVWILSTVLPRFAPVVSLDSFFDYDISNVQRYFTVVGTSTVACVLIGFAVWLRLEGSRALCYVHGVGIPLLVLCLKFGPGAVDRFLFALDQRRDTPVAAAEGWSVFAIPQQCEKSRWFRSTPDKKNQLVQRYTLPLVAEHSSDTSDIHFRLKRASIRKDGSETWRTFPGKNLWEYDTLAAQMVKRWTGELKSQRQNLPRKTAAKKRTWFDFEFTPDLLEGFQGEPVEISYDVHLVPYDLTEVALYQNLESTHTHRDGKVHFSTSATRIEWEKINGNAFFRSRTKLFSRVENLLWKRLFFGEPEPSVAVCIVEPKGSEHPGSLMDFILLHFRGPAVSAFPAISSEFQTSLSLSEKSADVSEIQRAVSDDSFHVHWLLLQPKAPLRATAEDYQRFFWVQPGKSMDSVYEDYADHPTGTWEMEQLGLLAKQPMSRAFNHQWSRIEYGLGLSPAESYKAELFQAAKLHPRLATLILANGWEKEAMDVWLDLARQQVALPAYVRRVFLRSGDSRLLHALEAMERWAPLAEANP